MLFVRSIPLVLALSVSIGCFKAGDDGVAGEGDTGTGEEVETSTQADTETGDTQSDTSESTR